jgi:hypothetical protein
MASIDLFSQSKKIRYSCDCSKLIKQVSTKWRADSLGHNKYRSHIAYRFTKCKVDNVNSSFVLENLGKPNEVYTTAGTIGYIYYSFSGRHASGWSYAEYLVFEFHEKTFLLLKIARGDNDRS